MKKLFFILYFLLLTFLHAQQTDTLYILQTTDLHGNIQPYDYFRDQPADYGLAKISTRVDEYRQKHKNVILLDGGDLLQGTPLAWYFNKVDTALPNPLILTLNFMDYDAFVVGNHDIEQGLAIYQRARKESKFPWLAANSVLPNGQTFFEPYTIIERNGIRIGVIGLTTPGIPMWLDKSLYPDISWTDMIETARKYTTLLRPQVDVLVGLFHAGFNEDYSSAQTQALGLPNENASRLVAEQVPGFDVILAGHSHQAEPREMVMIKTRGEEQEQEQEKDKSLKINAGSWGRNLGVAQIILRKKEKAKSRNEKWQVVQMNGWLEAMKEVQPSPAVLDLTRSYHEKTLAYIRTEIAELTDTLSAAQSRFADTPFMELINKAQLAATNADISFAACFDDRVKIAPGKIHIKDIYSIYRYENFLYIVEMTGQQIKDFLEFSAGYFDWDGQKLTVNRDIQGYNYDMAEGISYKINVKNKKGDRISDLVFNKTGQLLEMDKTYKVAMNSYRATGGGGYMPAAKAKDSRIVWKSSEDMRNILVDYIRNQKSISPKIDGNWNIIY